ncbi:MAG TPA: hypothetical protein VFR84_15790, partial [Candidatus Angelobacter sp.]|nr:hypothetical protein [Candidatus Angelobacter sp.]
MRVFISLMLFSALFSYAEQSVVPSSTGSTPDVIVFRNGDRLSGTITAQDANSITLQPESLGSPLTISRAQIAQIQIQSRKNGAAQQEHMAAGPASATPTPVLPSNSFSFALNS